MRFIKCSGSADREYHRSAGRATGQLSTRTLPKLPIYLHHSLAPPSRNEKVRKSLRGAQATTSAQPVTCLYCWSGIGCRRCYPASMLIFSIVAGVASIIGLVFSFLAFIQARRASKAAREARESILRRNFADELELSCTKMDQLLDLIHHDRLPEAAMKAGELTTALSELPFRRESYLNDDVKNQILNAREQVKVVEESVRIVRPLLTQKLRTLKAVRQTAMKLREILGKIKGMIDTGAKP